MRCKACNRMMHNPLKVMDPLTEEIHEEWICSKCDTLSFRSNPAKAGEQDDLLSQLELEGFIKTEEL